MTGFNIFGFRLAMAICLSLQMSGITEASGTLELKLNNFQNPTEHLRDGSCCDLFCAGGCDDIFHFSLDQSSGSTNDPQSYSYWTKVTGTYQDQNNVYFNDNMNDVANPIIWNFDSWPGTVLFKVYIEDDDQPYTGNDYLDGMVQRLTLTPARSKSSATVTTITMSGLRSNNPTSLSMTYKLYCNDNYYGASCSVYCVAQDTDLSGHYTCDPDTGAKICRPGWEDVSTDCKTFADDCVGHGCLNGARCVDGLRSYTCACVGGYTGRFCETNIDECASNPCLNGGTCSDLVNAFTCSCRSGYVGPRCAEAACVVSNPCINGGTCYDDSKCFCPDGYTGLRCELTKCQAVPCVNGGTCTSNGTCTCPPAFTGTQCEVSLCSLVSAHCQNGGSCINGACSCQTPFWGINCERQSCTTDTCFNGGSCTNTNDTTGHRCLCPESFTGLRCETSIAMQPCKGPDSSATPQPIKSNDDDVSIFQGDVGILLIILIIVCIILFLIIVALVVFLIWRRRRHRIVEKRRAVSTTSTTSTTTMSTVDIGNASSPSTANIYHDSPDDVFFPSGDKIEKPWKTRAKGSKGEHEECNKGFDRSENHYEHLEGGYVDAGGKDAEQGGYVQQDSGAPELPERYTCEIKDIHGSSIRMSEKLADC